MEEKELLSEEMLEKIMMGVAIAGTAKSLGKEALNQANQGDFQKARELFAEAKKVLLKFMVRILILFKKNHQEKKWKFAYFLFIWRIIS